MFHPYLKQSGRRENWASALPEQSATSPLSPLALLSPPINLEMPHPQKPSWLHHWEPWVQKLDQEIPPKLWMPRGQPFLIGKRTLQY